MRKSNHQKRASTRWDQNRIGKYSLEEIALEFIIWEEEAAHSDRSRRDFIHEALEQSLSDENSDQTLARFLHVYERLYEKIYQRKQGNLVKEDRASPRSVRQLLNPKLQRKAA